MIDDSNLTRFLLTDLVDLDSRDQLSIVCVMRELTKSIVVIVRLRIDLLIVVVACKHDFDFKFEHNFAKHNCFAIRNSKIEQK